MIAALPLLLAALQTGSVDPAPRRGTYVETSLGVFTAMGGSRAFSAAQPYLGLTLGRQLGERAALFASLGIGAASASCFEADAAGGCLGSDSFGATFVEGGTSYGFTVAPRALLSLKLLGGLTDLSPGPVQSSGSVPGHLRGYHFGGGASLDYATHLDHFAVGVDALFRYTLARYSEAGSSRTLGLPTLAVMPRIRYVF